MSSRTSRRSGANSNALNIATIQLLDRNRLIKELSERGLDTSGSKNVLSDRLYDFIVNGGIPEKHTPEKAVPAKKNKKTPTAPSKRKSVAKGTVKAIKNEEPEEVEEETKQSVSSSIIDIIDDEPDLLLLPSKHTTKEKIKVEVTDDATDSVFSPTAEEKLPKDSKRKTVVKNEPLSQYETTVTNNDNIPHTEELSHRATSDLKHEDGKKKKLKHMKSEHHDVSPDSSAISTTNKVSIDLEKKAIQKRQRDIGSSDAYDKVEPIVKRHKPSNSAPAKPKMASWQTKWAEKMEEHKKGPFTIASSSKQVSSEQVKTSEKQDVAKRKESSEKGEATKKKESPIEKIDTIAALISSTLVKPKHDSSEPAIKKERIADLNRARGGSDSGREYVQGIIHSVSSDVKPGFIQPSTSRISEKFSSLIQSSNSSALPPPPPPKVVHVTSSIAIPPPPSVPRKVHAVTLPVPTTVNLPNPQHVRPIALIPPPPPPPQIIQPFRRKSRFDQGPPEYLVGAPGIAPAPTLATSVSISKIDSPPPPPPPRNLGRALVSDGVPPPPPSSLKERIAIIFSNPGEVPITENNDKTNEASCSNPESVPLDEIKEDKSESIEPEPNVSSERSDSDIVLEKLPTPDGDIQNSNAQTLVEEVEDDDDDDDDFAIRDTFVETEPAITISVAERRKSMMVDEEGEYDPLENTVVEESSIIEYVPSTMENIDIVDMVAEDEEEGNEEEILKETEEEDDRQENEMDEETLKTEETLQESKDNLGNSKEGEQEKDFETLLTKQNARDLLKFALPVLESLTREKENESTDQYCQMIEEPTEEDANKNHEPENQEVYYHGDPVPDDDNELFEIAAGIKPAKKKEKKNLVQIPDEERLPSGDTIELDYYNADIHVKSAENNIWQIEPFSQDGLALMWGGVRSNFGIYFPFPQNTANAKSSKIGYQIEIDAFQKIQHLPSEFLNESGDVRVGFSLSSAPLILGEYSGSWCISSSGKKATNNHFYDSGSSFDVGDIITCVFDMENRIFSYKKNDENFSTIYKDISLKSGDVLFPTICVKNANVNVNFGQDLANEKWKISDNRDWVFLTEMDKSHLVKTRVAPESKSACTVLMTVGLPGVGKTTWVRRYLDEHPNENWNLISADVVMDAMRIDGVPRNRIPTLKRPDFLRGIIGKSMARLILLAPRRRKNYVLDMTNCIQEKRKRKLLAFEDFNRKCMIFVPDEDTHLKRLLKQEHEENEKLDTDALMQHKAAMSIPNAEVETFEELIFIDPPPPYEHLAYERVQKMNTDCRSWLVNPGNRRRNGQNNFYHNMNNQSQNNYCNLTISTGNNMSSGPSSSIQGTSQTNSPSVRMINITHTTFPSANGATMSPQIVNDKNSPVVCASSVMQPSPIAKSVSFDEAPTIIKADLTKPLMLNMGSHRLSTEQSMKFESVNEKSPRVVFHPESSSTPGVIFNQPPPQIAVPFQIDMKVPPPDFSTPPPPIPPHLIMLRQPSESQNAQNVFTPTVTYPPPQFTPR